MEGILPLILVLIISFLLGSVPWGLVISKVFFNKDIRKEGSGNIGTTNAMRSMGKVGGAVVFLLDFGKGVLSGFIGFLVAQNFLPGGGLIEGQLISQNTLTAAAFFGSVLGHIYSPWLGFRGGKGIAVAVGALFFIFGPVLTFVELGTFIVLVIVTRYVSVGSIAAALLCPIISVVLFWNQPLVLVFMCVAAFCVVYAHRENIKRLMAGNENRIGTKKKTEAAKSE